MAISAIGSAPASATGASSLGLQDFMRILLTQLTYQDPLKPMDNQSFMAQMAQFTSLEQTQRLNDRVQQLIENQAALQSVSLIGRTVDVATSTGQATGTVTSLSLQGETPLLTLSVAGGGVLQNVSLGQVLSVR
ncbi:MAG TPA: flagellar hook capping FlgD N-terminal domain-containing protein [Ramlibacter sp.]|uniref:flagellar hook assembly protein FlgD n=1 Tax=Ramlibacter sp. TaxID=1917967 RepID=UPI002ED161CD